jgi:hypothetical protein
MIHEHLLSHSSNRKSSIINEALVCPERSVIVGVGYHCLGIQSCLHIPLFGVQAYINNSSGLSDVVTLCLYREAASGCYV